MRKMTVGCFHALARLPEESVFQFQCTKCHKKLKVASGFPVADRATPLVSLKLTTDEVLAIINMLELRGRTPAEERILQECYKSKVRTA